MKTWSKKIACVWNSSGEALEMKLAETWSDIHSEEWERVSANAGIYLSISYLRSIEEANQNGLSYRYITFYKSDKPIGIAVFQITKASGDDLMNLSDNKRGKLLEKLKLTFLINGSMFYAGEPGFHFLLDEISQEDSLKALNQGVEVITKKKSCGINAVILKEFYETDHLEQTETLKEFSYFDFSLEPNMILKMDSRWVSYEDYLADMTAKYRNKSTRTYKKSDELIERELNLEDIKKYQADLDKLYGEVYENADFKLGRISAQTFILLKENLKENFIVKAYFLKDQMLGFLSATKNGDVLDANFVGIQYEYLKDYALYQRMLYDYVQLAIDFQVSELNLGRTAGEIKSTVGAVAAQTLCLIRLKNSISNHFIKPLVQSVEQQDFSHRYPFKKSFELKQNG